MTRVILLCGGGDWCDASADLLAVPDDLNLEDAKAGYAAWLEQWRMKRDGTPYQSFLEYLKAVHGVTDDATVETVWEP